MLYGLDGVFQLRINSNIYMNTIVPCVSKCAPLEEEVPFFLPISSSTGPFFKITIGLCVGVV